MNMRMAFLIVVVLSVPVIGYMLFRLFKLFNSPDGERYMKRRMQGPFVPLGKEDHAGDEAHQLEARRNKSIR